MGGFGNRGGEERGLEPGEFTGLEEIERGPIRLGQDVRFLFVAVGGGGVRIGREFARHKPRYVEAIAIHCEPDIQGLEEFDNRVTLQADPTEEPEGPAGPSALAKAAEPVLERIFDGAAFVAVVGTLGGRSGTGLFPSVVEAASRSAVVVSAFAVKPFAVEAERRGRADRALGRLPFLEAFVGKQQEGRGHLQVLDNESLHRRSPKMPVAGLSRHWAELIREYMEHNFLRPAESAVIASRSARLGEVEPLNRAPEPIRAAPDEVALLPTGPRELPAALAEIPGPDVELRFEIDLPVTPRDPHL